MAVSETGERPKYVDEFELEGPPASTSVQTREDVNSEVDYDTLTSEGPPPDTALSRSLDIEAAELIGEFEGLEAQLRLPKRGRLVLFLKRRGTSKAYYTAGALVGLFLAQVYLNFEPTQVSTVDDLLPWGLMVIGIALIAVGTAYLFERSVSMLVEDSGEQQLMRELRRHRRMLSEAFDFHFRQ